MDREEAIDNLKKILGFSPTYDEAFYTLFPEFRESEDERMMGDLIGGLMWQRDNLNSVGPHDDSLILPGFCLTVGEHLAYLKKQKERPEVDLEKTVEFECIGKRIKMTIQELINYYIDSECCDVANECGF